MTNEDNLGTVLIKLREKKWLDVQWLVQPKHTTFQLEVDSSISIQGINICIRPNRHRNMPKIHLPNSVLRKEYDG